MRHLWKCRRSQCGNGNMYQVVIWWWVHQRSGEKVNSIIYNFGWNVKLCSRSQVNMQSPIWYWEFIKCNVHSRRDTGGSDDDDDDDTLCIFIPMIFSFSLPRFLQNVDLIAKANKLALLVYTKIKLHQMVLRVQINKWKCSRKSHLYTRFHHSAPYFPI